LIDFVLELLAHNLLPCPAAPHSPAALPSSNPIADNADLNKLGQSAERLKNDVQTATNTNKGPFGSVKSSVQSGVDQVKDAASSVTPSSNPLQRVTESVKNGECSSHTERVLPAIALTSSNFL
jgi:hypothetical protein